MHLSSFTTLKARTKYAINKFTSSLYTKENTAVH